MVVPSTRPRFIAGAGLLATSVLLLACATHGATLQSQIHLALGKTPDTVVVSWAQSSPFTPVVKIWSSSTPADLATGSPASTYSTSSVPKDTYSGFQKYTSPYIGHVTINKLLPDTKYTYTVGDTSGQFAEDTFSFTTPPSVGSREPIQFSVVGDLGQTPDSQATVAHMGQDNESRLILHAGDMSYADCLGSRWDSWAEMVQPLAVQRPWMVVAGNHEVEPDGTGKIMSGLKNRFQMPQSKPGIDTSQYFQNPDQHGYDCTPSAFTGNYSYGNSFYSFDVASVHVVALNSYTQTGTTSPQFQWLEADLASVDRTVTPWVIAMWHSPWYNSNDDHQHEFNTINMRASMESLFWKYGVSVAFCGHVHAYQRSHPVYLNASTPMATTYINIGDGGNREGHAYNFETAPEWSAFTDGDHFGHGTLKIVNDTHAYWGWHRNTDDDWKVDDSVWIENAPLRRFMSL